MRVEVGCLLPTRRLARWLLLAFGMTQRNSSRPRFQFMAALATAGLAVLVVPGCATPGTRPDDMSADEHRAAAAHEEGESEHHADQYDPDAEVGQAIRAGEYEFAETYYNPTENHQRSAERHKTHAAEHLAAAKALEGFEQAECASFPPKTRAVCPILGNVVASQPTPSGATLTLAKDVNVAAAAAHVRCHLAYARTKGHKGMPGCPLYLKGVQSKTNGNTIDLTISDAEQVKELQRRAAEHVGSE